MKMKYNKILLAAVLLAVCIIPAVKADTIVPGVEKNQGMIMITFDWTSDASGDATGTTTLAFTGCIQEIDFIPDSGGTQPTSLYDVVVEDEDGVDKALSQGANLSNTVATQPGGLGGLIMIGYSQITVTVSNAGNAKGGKVKVYIDGTAHGDQ